MKRFLIASLVALILAAGVLSAGVVGATENDNEGEDVLTPASPAYFTQQIMEQVQFGVMDDAGTRRADFTLQMMERRASEMDELQERGRPEYIPGLVRQTARLSEILQEECDGLDLEDIDAAALAGAIARVTERADEVLKALEGELPDEARDGIKRARKAIGGNHEFAASVLQQIIDGELPGDPEAAESALEGLQRAGEGAGDRVPPGPGRPELDEKDGEENGNDD